MKKQFFLLLFLLALIIPAAYAETIITRSGKTIGWEPSFYDPSLPTVCTEGGPFFPYFSFAGGDVYLSMDCSWATFVPADGYIGEELFFFSVSSNDGIFLWEFVLGVEPNFSPQTKEISLVTTQDTPVNWVPDATDANSVDKLTCSIFFPSKNGTLSVDSDCSGGTYTPHPEFTGSDCSGWYVATDGELSQAAKVCVEVTPPTVACATPPSISGFWLNGPVAPNALVFVFGKDFCLDNTSVAIAGIPAPSMTIIDSTLLIAMMPEGVTVGPIEITTDAGSATSAQSIGATQSTLAINGFWPAEGAANSVALVFGAHFDLTPGATQVTLNGQLLTTMHTVDSNMLMFLVPANFGSGPITITTPQGSVTSTEVFTVLP